MKNQSNFILTLLRIAFWFTFIGLLISLLSIIWVLISHHFHWEMPRKYYSGINFTDVFNKDRVSFNVVLTIEFINTFLKLIIIWYSIKILKNLNFQNPFSEVFLSLINKISFAAMIVGILSLFLIGYVEKFVDNKLLLSTQIGDSNYLVIAGIIYIVGQLYKKALDLKSENDLTI